MNNLNVNENENFSFTVTNENGESVVCDVLFTFESDETHKNYIVYTDNTKDESGNVKVYASCYNPDQDEQELQPIETDKEWKLIEVILSEMQQQINSGEISGEN